MSRASCEIPDENIDIEIESLRERFWGWIKNYLESFREEDCVADRMRDVTFITTITIGTIFDLLG